MRALVAILALASAAAAQDPEQPVPECYHVSSWTIASGLPQGSINDLVQTADGALWAATFGGLVRFDGLEFRVFDLETLPGMPTNRVTTLALDEADGLWVGLQSGHLLHFRDGKILELLTIPDTDVIPLSVLRHPGGSVWVQSLSGTVRRYADGSWAKLSPSGPPGSYEGLCLDRDGNVCAAVGAELVVYASEGRELRRVQAPSRILSLPSVVTGTLWIGLADGLGRLGPNGIQRVSLTPAVDIGVECMLVREAGDLWLGTSAGPMHVSPPDQPPRLAWVESSELLPAITPRTMIADREGNIWVGAYGYGLIRMRPQQVFSFGSPEWRTGVTSLADDGEGGAWISLGCKGLFHLADQRWEPEAVRFPRLEGRDNCIDALLRDEQGRIWAGMEGQILRLDLHVSGEFQRVLETLKLEGAIGPMIRGASGEVWISTQRGHLVRLGPDDVVLEEHDLPCAVHSLALGRDGAVWVGGPGVLLRVGHDKFCSFGVGSGLPRGVLRDILPEADGGIWVASYGGGLGYFKDGVGRTVSRAHGMPDNSLTAIRADGRGNLWILSNLGLVVAPREELLAVALGSTPKFVPVVLGPEAGMPESEFGEPASMTDSQGRLWFGTISGPVRIQPREFPFNRTPARVRIERVRADDVALPLNGRVQVPALTRRLELGYTAFALTAPERTSFRYQLEGFDDHWIDAGAERFVAFTSLAPGPYRFRVAARNEDGIWSESPALLEIDVLPAWWQTWVFRSAALLAVALLLVLVHRFRVDVVRRRGQVLLEATEGRARAEERESRLRDQLAHAGRVATAGELASSLAHEVNQPLAAIVTNAEAGQRFLARDPMARAELDDVLGDIAQQGQRASAVIRRLREFLRKHETERSEVDLNAVLRDTLPLLRREIEDYGVQTVLALQERLPAIQADPVQLQQVLVNLIKNSCEALAGVPGPRSIEIRSRSYDGRVLIEVCDNGPGLAPEVSGRLFQPYVTTKPDGMGLGLAICRSIVEAHGGSLAADARLGGGVIFHIDLPGTAGTRS